MEIFYEESNVLINELKNALFDYKECKSYGSEFIQKVFRDVHTMKADSTMMLFDTIAALSRAFESVLYFYRNNSIEIEDTEYFNHLLISYVDYIKGELDKLPEGKPLYAGHTELEKEMKEYLVTIKEEYKDRIVDDITAKTDKSTEEQSGKKRSARQVYYIPSAETSTISEVSAQKEPKEKELTADSDAVVLIKQKDIQNVYNTMEAYSKYVEEIENRFVGEQSIVLNQNELARMKDMKRKIFNSIEHLTKSDFKTVAKKMEMLVDEMASTLKKPVKLLVTGEDTMIDKSKREKVSSALIHIIRNAVDHGIEDMEERDIMGKSPMGLVRLSFSKKEDKIEICVEDDGAGIDKDAVIKSAIHNNLLNRAPEEYTDEEIYGMLLHSGVSTTDEPNDYSGRGVGMDVINHNVKELGGELKISSREGYGTKITMIV